MNHIKTSKCITLFTTSYSTITIMNKNLK